MLDHLYSEQQTLLREMLQEECKAFTQDENHVGYIPSLCIHHPERSDTSPKDLHQCTQVITPGG